MNQQKQTPKTHRWVRRILALALALVLTLTAFPQSSYAADDRWPADPDTIGPSMIVMDEETGTVLYEKNADEQLYPASITKIMTALVALENCQDLSETVTFSEDAVYNTYGSSIARDVGEQMTMEQCLYAMMLASANECAYAIAEHVGGTVDEFVNMMNAKAQELGCTNTHFDNSSGLPDTEHYTTAHDMAIIARAAWQNEEFRTICGTGTYTIPPTNKHSEETLLQNHHLMLYPYKGIQDYLESYCVGGKTGYTDDAQFTLVTYGQENGMTLICVVMDEASQDDQYVDTDTALTHFFDTFTGWNIQENETELSGSGDAFFNTDADIFHADSELYRMEDGEAGVILPNGVDFSEADRSFSLLDTSGTKAKVTYSYDNRTVGEVQLDLNTSIADAPTESLEQIRSISAANEAAEEAEEPDTTKGKAARFIKKAGVALQEFWWNVQDFAAYLMTVYSDLRAGKVTSEGLIVLIGFFFIVALIITIIIYSAHRRRGKKKRGEKKRKKYDKDSVYHKEKRRRKK